MVSSPICGKRCGRRRERSGGKDCEIRQKKGKNFPVGDAGTETRKGKFSFLGVRREKVFGNRPNAVTQKTELPNN